MDGIKQQHDYSIEVLREEAKTHRTKAEYEDFLARKRNEDRAKLETDSHSELLKSQEESVKRQEKLRKDTIDYEYQKRVATERELAAEFWKNKSTYKNETKELSLAKYSMKMEGELKKSEMWINTFGNMIRDGCNCFYDNKPKFLAFTTGLCILTAGLVLSRRGVTLIFKQVESYLFTPKLVKEHFKTSTLNKIFTPKSMSTSATLPDMGLVYNKETEQTLIHIIESTKTCLTNKGFLRNFLFFGAPGTGKTLFAKKLAATSGLNYAIISGGDIVPLKEKAVTEIHKVFDWATRSRGLLLFLDEADAFLKKRDQIIIGEDMRSALNSFLYRTGESSRNLMLILGTNRPDQLDRAITDRIDMVVEFPLPDQSARERLFSYYYNLHIKDLIQPIDFEIQDILPELVAESDGFSAREISKLILTWQIIGFTTGGAKLTREAVLQSMRSMKKQHGVKQDWDKMRSLK